MNQKRFVFLLLDESAVTAFKNDHHALNLRDVDYSAHRMIKPEFTSAPPEDDEVAFELLSSRLNATNTVEKLERQYFICGDFARKIEFSTLVGLQHKSFEASEQTPIYVNTATGSLHPAFTYIPETPQESSKIENHLQNIYEHCGVRWTDTGDSEHNDRCVVCDKEIMPVQSIDLNHPNPPVVTPRQPKVHVVIAGVKAAQWTNSGACNISNKLDQLTNTGSLVITFGDEGMTKKENELAFERLTSVVDFLRNTGHHHDQWVVVLDGTTEGTRRLVIGASNAINYLHARLPPEVHQYLYEQDPNQHYRPERSINDKPVHLLRAIEIAEKRLPKPSSKKESIMQPTSFVSPTHGQLHNLLIQAASIITGGKRSLFSKERVLQDLHIAQSHPQAISEQLRPHVIEVITRAIAGLETPGDLSSEEKDHLAEDIRVASKKLLEVKEVPPRNVKEMSTQSFIRLLVEAKNYLASGGDCIHLPVNQMAEELRAYEDASEIIKALEPAFTKTIVFEVTTALVGSQSLTNLGKERILNVIDSALKLMDVAFGETEETTPKATQPTESRQIKTINVIFQGGKFNSAGPIGHNHLNALLVEIMERGGDVFKFAQAGQSLEDEMANHTRMLAHLKDPARSAKSRYIVFDSPNPNIRQLTGEHADAPLLFSKAIQPHQINRVAIGLEYSQEQIQEKVLEVLSKEFASPVFVERPLDANVNTIRRGIERAKGIVDARNAVLKANNALMELTGAINRIEQNKPNPVAAGMAIPVPPTQQMDEQADASAKPAWQAPFGIPNGDPAMDVPFGNFIFQPNDERVAAMARGLAPNLYDNRGGFNWDYQPYQSTNPNGPYYRPRQGESGFPVAPQHVSSFSGLVLIHAVGNYVEETTEGVYLSKLTKLMPAAGFSMCVYSLDNDNWAREIQNNIATSGGAGEVLHVIIPEQLSLNTDVRHSSRMFSIVSALHQQLSLQNKPIVTLQEADFKMPHALVGKISQTILSRHLGQWARW